jgi:hypothetical protein
MLVYECMCYSVCPCDSVCVYATMICACVNDICNSIRIDFEMVSVCFQFDVDMSMHQCTDNGFLTHALMHTYNRKNNS